MAKTRRTREGSRGRGKERIIMANVVGTRKSDRILSGQDMADIQQPLSRDGYTNDQFDKLYGKDSNPSIGTERDRGNKRKQSSFSINPKAWDRIFGYKNEETTDKLKKKI